MSRLSGSRVVVTRVPSDAELPVSASPDIPIVLPTDVLILSLLHKRSDGCLSGCRRGLFCGLLEVVVVVVLLHACLLGFWGPAVVLQLHVT